LTVFVELNPRFVYITCASPEEANAIGKSLVEERLAACANIIPGMTSWYRWNDKIENGEETILILKSSAELADEVIRRVKELHSYEVPCIVFLPILEGNPDYLEWMRSSLK